MTQTEQLIHEIGSLNSVKFEQLCYILCDALAERPLIHRGLTCRGQPRKNTVDSYASDSSIVGEYSIDDKYFSVLSKPEHDVEHALKLHPAVKVIYLLASAEATSTEGTGMANLCARLQKNRQIEIEWYDSRRIAEYILNELLPKTVLVEKLGKFLSSLKEIYASNPNTVHLPELPKNYRIGQSMLETPYRILHDKHILLFSGVSGIGKTCLAAKIADIFSTGNKLDAVYFINAAQIKTACDLYAVGGEVAGQKINLVGTLQTRHALFIIDDLQCPIDPILEILERKIGSSSYVIITSQVSSRLAEENEMEYSVPYLDDEDLVEEIVNSGLPGQKRCSKEDIKLILQKTHGYPLLLNSIHSALLFDTIDQSEIQEFLESVSFIEVDVEKTLMSKLLSRHLGVLERELLSIRWLGSQYISEPLLAKLIAKEGVSKLLKRSLIQRSAGIIKIHDIIYQCILDISIPLEGGSDRVQTHCRQQFYKFLTAEREKKSADYFKALHLHKDKIVGLAEQCGSPGVEWFFCLHAFSGGQTNEIAPFSGADDLIDNWLVCGQDEYVVRTALEYIDRRLREMGWKDPKYKDFVQKQIDTLSSAKERWKSVPKIYADIVHHLGKLYSGIGELLDASRCFEEALTYAPPFYEAKLQMARIHKKAKGDFMEQAIEEYREILDTYILGKAISMSVVLAAYGDLCSIKGHADLKEYYFIEQFTCFENAVSSMAVDSFDQPYKVLASAMKFYSHPYPEKATHLINCIPIPSIETIEPNSCLDIAQMYKEAGKAIIWEETPDQQQAISYLLMAEDFYFQIKGNQLCQEYASTQRAENLILLDRLPEAARLLEQYPFPDSPFWNYRMGQALADGSEEDLQKAVEHFRTAINIEEERGEDRYLSAFYHGYAKTLTRLNNSYAKDAFDKALEYCTNDKYRKQIMKDIAYYQNECSL